MAQHHKLTIAQASARMSEGSLTPTELVASCLARIDQREPVLKAWVTVDREGALEAAGLLDREMEVRGPRSPLHGIPVGIKDIYYTAGLKTTAGSKVYADFVPDYDATSVERLKAAGAIILGKTVTTEFATGDPPPTVNPWHSAHTPGGSSSGSAVAVSDRMVPGGMGSQTGGSIIRPSSYNGIVGLKPTFGRVSIYGVIPVSWSLDTIGPMVNSVEDAALMLQALAGYDPKDPGSADEPVPDYRRGLDQLEGPPRIGLIRDFFYPTADDEVRKHTDAVAEKLSRAGAEVEEVTLPPSFATIYDAHRTVMNVECATYHEEMFQTRAHEYSPKIRNYIESGFLIPATYYVQSLRLRRLHRREMTALASQWDALLTPTTHAAAPRDLSTTGDPVFQIPWTSTGLPTITIPSGLGETSGLPLGIQLGATPFDEERLLAVAQWCEQALDVHLEPPGVVPS